MSDVIPEVRRDFVTANGLRFDVASRGKGHRLALCLHGFPECWVSWRFQFDLLERLGYRIWAPNLRGYGASDKPPRVEDYSVECLMQDVAGLIDAAGARETVLLAHDWGGIIAWYFAMRRIRPLDGLVVMNCPHPTAAFGRFGWRQRLRSWYALLFQLPWLPEKLLSAGNYRAVTRSMLGSAAHPENFPAEVMEVFRQSAAQPGAATAMINYYRALVRGGGAARQRALGSPEIDTRTLLIWGERDIALTVETTLDTGDYVKDLTLRYLPNASHWVQQDEPEATNEILEAWLTRTVVPGAAAPSRSRSRG